MKNFQKIEQMISYILPAYAWKNSAFGLEIIDYGSGNGEKIITQYFIRCLDGSEIEYMLVGSNSPHFSTVDCMKGKQRNQVRTELKKLTHNDILDFFNYLENTYGLTDTNNGKAIIVSKKNVKTQIILD